MIEIYHGKLSVEEYYELYSSVGWMVPPKDQIDRALENSLLTAKAVIDEKIVGMGRLIGDGSLFFMVKDVAVFPEYQRQGICTKIMGGMITHIKQQIPKDQNVCVELFSGFEKKPSMNSLDSTRNQIGLSGTE